MRLSTLSPLLKLGVLVLFNQELANAGVLRLDFEQFADSTQLTTQIPGLTFSNATVISAGITLNEFEFPPHSGSSAVFDDGGQITISFSAPLASFSGYFTYAGRLTLLAFDASNNQVGRVFTQFSSNLALSGDAGSSPNELLEVDALVGISSVAISGDPSGSSFVADDLTIDSAAPEPNFLFLFLSATAATTALRRKQKV